MTNVRLIYPYFLPRRDRSVFRFPPLGIAYVAACLRERGHDVSVLDCTFLSRQEGFTRAATRPADVVGIYGMVTMREDCLALARHLRGSTKLLVAGGPLPTSNPGAFLPQFDVIVRGEGERTMAELLTAFERGTGFCDVPGLAFKDATAPGGMRVTPKRELEPNLDGLPFPARDLLPNDEYIRYGQSRYGYAISSVMTTRGCPFQCEFCSNEVFGISCRERSVEKVLDEVQQVLALGFQRIHFADDVFTLNRRRLLDFCNAITQRRINFQWECLARADTVDRAGANAMRAAGCSKVYFGLESGNDATLTRMNKRVTAIRARQGVEAAHAAGIKTGGFFILFYPGDTDETVLDTIRYAVSLPLDYLSFTLPYPIPGTALYGRLEQRRIRDWQPPRGWWTSHQRIYDGDFSTAKMRLGLLKGSVEFMAKKHVGSWAARAVAAPTDWVWQWLR